MNKILYIYINRNEFESAYKNKYYFYFSDTKIQYQNQSIDALIDQGFQLVSDEKKYLLESYNKLIDDLQNLSINNKKLPEYLCFEGISLWQFITGHIYCSFLFDTIEFIEYVTSLIIKYNPSKVIIFGNTEEYQNQLITEIANQYQIEFDFQRPVTEKKSIVKRGYQKLKYYYNKFSIYKILAKPKIEPKIDRSISNYLPDGNIALFASMPRAWTFIESHEEIDLYCNAFKYFLSTNSLTGIRVDMPYYFNLSTSIDEYKKRTVIRGGFNSVFFDDFISKDIIERANTFLKHFTDAYNYLKTNMEFLNGFKWKGISFYEPLRNYWENLFTKFLIDTCIVSLFVARKILKEIKPKVLFAYYEVGIYSRSLIIEAHRLGIPSIGMQHGLMFPEHEYGLEKNQSVEPNFEKGFYGYVAPSKTLVYGENAVRVYSKFGSYPKESLINTGDWRLININLKNLEEVSKRKVNEWFGESEKKIFLILTSGNMKDQFLEIIKRIDSKLFNIIIKLHPMDNEIGFYDNSLQNSNFQYTITRQFLYESIYASSFVFTSCYSTTVAESLFFGKIVICDKNNHSGMTLPWINVVFDITEFDKDLDLSENHINETQKLLKELGMSDQITQENLCEKLNVIAQLL